MIIIIMIKVIIIIIIIMIIVIIIIIIKCTYTQALKEDLELTKRQMRRMEKIAEAAQEKGILDSVLTQY